MVRDFFIEKPRAEKFMALSFAAAKALSVFDDGVVPILFKPVVGQ